MYKYFSGYSCPSEDESQQHGDVITRLRSVLLETFWSSDFASGVSAVNVHATLWYRKLQRGCKALRHHYLNSSAEKW